jgi:hypothetical protein
MKSIVELIKSYKTIILVNDSNYVGDSVIFFLPFVNTLLKICKHSEIVVFHRHNNQFRPIIDSVFSYDIEKFYDIILTPNGKLVLAFTPKFGELKNYLKQKGFQSIVKDFVGLNFISLNIPYAFIKATGLQCEFIDGNECRYLESETIFHYDSGFPMLNHSFSNVYEYSKICIEEFLCCDSIINVIKENIVINNCNLEDHLSDLFILKIPKFNRPYILINFICGTLKLDVLEKYSSLLNWIERIAKDFVSFNLFILCDFNFAKLRSDIDVSLENIYFLKEDTSKFWNSLILNARLVYSIDTGFLHIAHILNKNTFGFGGDVDFWFFKDKIIKIEDF